MTTTEKLKRGALIRPLANYFRNNPNTELEVQTIATALGFNTQQVQRGCWCLINQKGWTDLHVLIRGLRWVYRPGMRDLTSDLLKIKPKRETEPTVRITPYFPSGGGTTTGGTFTGIGGGGGGGGVSAPPAANSKRMFEELAITSKGDILVQCEDGKVYKLVEL